MDEGDGGALGGGDGPALAQKVDLVVGVDPAFQMEGQVQVQQGGWRARAGGRPLLGEGLFPGGIGTQPRRAADRGILALQLAVEHDLGGRVAADLFIRQEGHEAVLHGAEAAFDLALGLRAGRDEMRHAQGGEGALEFGTGIAVIGHGIMAEEAQAVRVHHHGQAVLEQQAAKVLEVIPSGVGGDKYRAQQFAGMIIHGQQQGLLRGGGPPLVDGGIVLPQFIDTRPFPAPPGAGPGWRLANEVGEVLAGKGRHRLAMALETEAGGQFVGHQLEVGRLLEGQELLEEGSGFRRPVGPVVAPGELGGEGVAVPEETGAEPIQVGTADLEEAGGLGDIDQPRIELLKDLLEKQVGEALGDLLFSWPQSNHPSSQGRGLSSAFATLRPPQALAPGTVPATKPPVPF